MDNNSNNNNVQRYQASSTNLNTVISNPTVNINDTMNMNIQNMSSNQGINNTANGNVNSMINPSVTAPNIMLAFGIEEDQVPGDILHLRLGTFLHLFPSACAELAQLRRLAALFPLVFR